MDNSTKVSIIWPTSYLLGKYASRTRAMMFLNLSSPKPIIIAEKVPPKTIIIDEKRKRAWNEPPSRKNAPKIEKRPSSNPKKAPVLLIISNQKEILALIQIKVYKIPEVNILDFVIQSKAREHQYPEFLNRWLQD